MTSLIPPNLGTGRRTTSKRTEHKHPSDSLSGQLGKVAALDVLPAVTQGKAYRSFRRKWVEICLSRFPRGRMRSDRRVRRIRAGADNIEMGGPLHEVRLESRSTDSGAGLLRYGHIRDPGPGCSVRLASSRNSLSPCTPPSASPTLAAPASPAMPAAADHDCQICFALGHHGAVPVHLFAATPPEQARLPSAPTGGGRRPLPPLFLFPIPRTARGLSSSSPTDRRSSLAAHPKHQEELDGQPGLRGARRVPPVLSLALATSFAADPGRRRSRTPATSRRRPVARLDIIAKQLDIARKQIQPSLGATVYDFNRQAIETQPQGDNQPLNQLLLQAPGVAQDSFGQLHVRGDHANLQFRINGVQLPEGINVFGQSLQTRLANSVALITGALPAQYGLRTAGIIDIQTKTGTLDPGGSMTLYGGQQAWFQPSVEFGGRVGQIDYYVTGEYSAQQRSGSRTRPAAINAIHDIADQPRGFAYVSGIIDPNTRLTAILGASRSQFQIPQHPGLTPGLGLTVNGVSDFPSAALNENQRQINDFAIITLQKRAGADRFSDLGLQPLQQRLFLARRPARADPLSPASPRPPTAAASPPACRATAAGGAPPSTRLRSGFYIQGERSTFSTTSDVLPVDDIGMQTTDQPLSILDSGGKTGWLYSYYLQDEWKIVPTLTLNFGARFDLVDEFTHEHQLSPRVNVVWQPTETTTFTAGYSRYFMPPPFELVAEPTINALRQHDRRAGDHSRHDLKAERDHYFDVGASQIILPGLKAGVDAYYKLASNLIDEGQFGAPIILTPVQLHEGIVKGVELLLSYDSRQTGHFTATSPRRRRSARTSPRRSSTSPPTISPYRRPLHPSRSRPDLHLFGRYQVPSADDPVPCFPPT